MIQLDFSDLIASSGWLFGFGAFLFAWWQHSTAARDRKELRDIRRRAAAPLLVPSDQRFQNLIEDSGQRGHMTFWPSSYGNVLCVLRDEVEEDLVDGDPVILAVQNNGETAARIRVKLDGEPIECISEPDVDGAHGLQFLRYPFQARLRGTEQRVEVWFECRGVQDTHHYRTVHARRVLDRTDPP